MIRGLHHVSVSVANLESGIELYRRLGFDLEMQSNYADISARFAMVSDGNSRLELWEFNNPSHEMVSKIKHHIAFISDDLEADITLLEEQGASIAIPITDGDRPINRFASLQDAAGNFIELCELADS